mgnify:CR=1 FL=1
MTARPGEGARSRRVAVTLVHGIGGQSADFADGTIAALRRAFHAAAPEAPDDALVFAPTPYVVEMLDICRKTGVSKYLRRTRLSSRCSSTRSRIVWL